MAENTAAPAAPAAPAVSSDAPVVASKADAKVAPKASASPAVKVDENGVGEAPKKLWKLNVNGKEVEYDASNEDKMKADLQKVFGIEEKARTSAQKADMAEKLMGMLQTDPIGFEKQCKLNGIDATKLATEILYNQLRLQSMTPEQRELEDYKQREAEAKALKEQQEAERKLPSPTERRRNGRRNSRKNAKPHSRRTPFRRRDLAWPSLLNTLMPAWLTKKSTPLNRCFLTLRGILKRFTVPRWKA